MKKRLLFFVTFSLCFTIIRAQANRKLAIVGSSTSACTGPSTYDSCYVGRLVNYYSSVGAPITVYNIAIGGTNPYQAMPTGYVPPANRPATNTNANITNAINSNPAVILVNFPSNGYCEYTIAEVMNCFRIIKQAAGAAGIPCYITTTQPRQEGCFLNDSVQLKITRIKDSVLQQFGYYGIDFYTTLANPADSTIASQYNSGDGIHLNNAGHRILFERVRDKNIFNPVILPLKFIRFTSSIKNGKGLLEWTTAAEENLQRFVVEKSLDGIFFTPIEAVQATNTGGLHSYSFTDNNPLTTAVFYRIAAIDKDGKTATSAIVKLAADYPLFQILKTTNAGGEIIINLYSTTAMAATVQLFNSTGQQLTIDQKILVQGTNTIRVLPPAGFGLYFLKVMDANGSTAMGKILMP